MILLLDNYDSFTFNLYQALSELGAEVMVRRNDKVTSMKSSSWCQRWTASSFPRDHVRRAKPVSPSRWCGGSPGRCRSSASASDIRRSARPSAARSSARQGSCMARHR